MASERHWNILRCVLLLLTIANLSACSRSNDSAPASGAASSASSPVVSMTSAVKSFDLAPYRLTPEMVAALKQEAQSQRSGAECLPSPGSAGGNSQEWINAASQCDGRALDALLAGLDDQQKQWLSKPEVYALGSACHDNYRKLHKICVRDERTLGDKLWSVAGNSWNSDRRLMDERSALALMLLGDGARVNVDTSSSALHEAATSGNVKIVQALLAFGHPVDGWDDDSTPLYASIVRYAVGAGSMPAEQRQDLREVIAVLVAQGANVQASSDRYGPLADYVKKEGLSEISAILAAGLASSSGTLRQEPPPRVSKEADAFIERCRRSVRGGSATGNELSAQIAWCDNIPQMMRSVNSIKEMINGQGSACTGHRGKLAFIRDPRQIYTTLQEAFEDRCIMPVISEAAQKPSAATVSGSELATPTDLACTEGKVPANWASAKLYFNAHANGNMLTVVVSPERKVVMWHWTQSGDGYRLTPTGMVANGQSKGVTPDGSGAGATLAAFKPLQGMNLSDSDGAVEALFTLDTSRGPSVRRLGCLFNRARPTP